MLVDRIKSYSFVENVKVHQIGCRTGASSSATKSKRALKNNKNSQSSSSNTEDPLLDAETLIGNDHAYLEHLMSLGDASSGALLFHNVDDKPIELSFKGYNSTYTLHLKPKRDLLLQSSSTVEIDGVPVSHDDWAPKVFEGTVQGVEGGWARFVVHNPAFDPKYVPPKPDGSESLTDDDGVFGAKKVFSGFTSKNGVEDLLFEGVFQTDSGLYHVKTVDMYQRARRDIDTDIATPFSRQPSQRRSKMIIFSESDEIPHNDHTCSIKSSPYSSSKSSGSCSKRSLQIQQSSCGFSMENEHNDKAFDRLNNILGKRSLEKRAPGCSSSKQYLFIGAAADCTYVSAYNGPSGALAQILADFNTASKVYESSFNVALALIKVNLQSSCDTPDLPWNQECSASYSINKRLSDFSYWRGNKDRGENDNAGLWHLMTGCSSTVSGQAVGVAWLQTTCLTRANPQMNALTGVNEYVSGTGVSSKVPVEWKVVAHEVGHNFGAIHDCDISACACQGNPGCKCCQCPGGCDCKGQFLMHPTDNAVTSNFSACSIDNICNTLQDPDRSNCLRPPGSLQTISENICGNGVKEGNEECDCGSAADCANDPCCDGKTCKLTPGSVCDDLNDDCCSKCQLRAQGQVCRKSIGICDYAETCTGLSATCPKDLHHPNQEPCGNGLACASGICTSRAQQCQSKSQSFNTTGVCPGRSSDCQLLCVDQNGNCLQLAGAYIDGTSCGYNGVCQTGQCKEGSFVGTVIGWFQSNPQLAIPVAVAVGLVILTIISALIQCCCRRCGRNARQNRVPKATQLPVVTSTTATQGSYGYYAPNTVSQAAYVTAGSPPAGSPAPAGPAASGPPRRTDAWVDPTAYNGPSR
ncbi:hypothetical protein HDV05_007769 [Chytridiales sp. JEL 0842]|nr:hypothetical protein HDV05_007769 [Chytridiales sp. JEL 0842]